MFLQYLVILVKREFSGYTLCAYCWWVLTWLKETSPILHAFVWSKPLSSDRRGCSWEPNCFVQVLWYHPHRRVSLESRSLRVSLSIRFSESSKCHCWKRIKARWMSLYNFFVQVILTYIIYTALYITYYMWTDNDHNGSWKLPRPQW